MSKSLTSSRWFIVGVYLIIVCTMLFLMGRTVVAQEASADLSGSMKMVSSDSAEAGDPLTYTIMIQNSGNMTGTQVLLTDTLPSAVMYMGSLSAEATDGVSTTMPLSYTNGSITWGGSLPPSSRVTVTFAAMLYLTATDGTTVTNIAYLDGNGMIYTLTAQTVIPEIITEPITETQYIYLPIIMTPLMSPRFGDASRPNSNNEWTIAWSSVEGVSGYELQEDNDPTFGSPTEYAVATNRYTFQKTASWENEYYYRVRAVNSFGIKSEWSGSTTVVGAYFDGFDDPNSGWEIVRWTNAGSPANRVIKSFYETLNGRSQLAIQVLDKWDWGITSPLKKAPALPYQIEFSTQAANLGNLLSHGVVYGADYTGGECIIDDGTEENLYQRTNCFNHFYNTNIINKSIFGYDQLKLNWERIDRLVWCRSCSQAAMKRLSDEEKLWPYVEPIPNVSKDGWNVWRVEVRADHSSLFVNDRYIAQFKSGRWNTDPYFGLFASTDEYNNSTWRLDWVRIVPLDN